MIIRLSKKRPNHNKYCITGRWVLCTKSFFPFFQIWKSNGICVCEINNLLSRFRK